MGRRNILIAIVTVLVVVAAVVVVLRVSAADPVDATTSDAPAPTVGTALPTSFDRPAWRRPVPADAQVIVSDGYVAVRERTGVRVYDLPTGKERWHHLDDDREVIDIAAADGRLTAVSDGEVRLFDLATGQVRATVSVPAGDRTAVPYGDLLLVLSDGEAADPYRMYSASGRQLWSRFAESCIGGTQAYFGAGALVIASYCGPVLHVAGVHPDDGNVLWDAELPDTTTPGLGSTPTATRLPTDAPLLAFSQGKLTPIEPATGTRLTGAPVPDGAQPTSVPNGWCSYEPTPESLVRCVDMRTGTAPAQPYPVAHNDLDDPRVEILSGAAGIAVAVTTDGTLTVGKVGGRPVEVMSDAAEPSTVYYGPGALVVTDRDELIVYS